MMFPLPIVDNIPAGKRCLSETRTVVLRLPSGVFTPLSDADIDEYVEEKILEALLRLSS